MPGVSSTGSPSWLIVGGAFLAGPAGDEVEAVDRRPVRARADRRQRAEIRQLVDLGIGVEREVAERAEIAVAARDRQVEVDRRRARWCGRASLECRRPRAAPAGCRDADGAGADAEASSLASPAGSLNSVPLAVAVRSPEVVVSRARSRGKAAIVAVGAGDVAVQVGIAGDVPAPLRLVPVERDAGVGAVAVGVARERLERGVAEADQRAAFAMLELGVERRRHVAEDLCG